MSSPGVCVSNAESLVEDCVSPGVCVSEGVSSPVSLVLSFGVPQNVSLHWW